MSPREELFERKRCAMELMDTGETWQVANEQSGLSYSKSGIHRLYREWNKRGDEALVDHRNGHPYKATSDVREWLSERCTNDPEVRASQLTVEIEAQFDMRMDLHHVGLLRRQLGLPVPRPGRPSKEQETKPAPATEPARDFSPSRGEGSGPAM